MSRVSLDANVFVYGVDASDAARHRAAKRLITLAARHDCVLVLQALAEFYYIATRKAGFPASGSRRLRRVALQAAVRQHALIHRGQKKGFPAQYLRRLANILFRPRRRTCGTLSDFEGAQTLAR